MPVDEEYLLPAGIGPAAMSRLLGTSFTLDADAPRTTVRTCYDTFDGRLRSAGRTLVHEHGRLTLLHEGVGIERSAAPARLMVAELPAGALRALLAPIVGVRALTPTVRIRTELREARVLDDEGKTVVRLVVEAPRGPDAIRPRLRLLGVRGYDKALGRARRKVERDLGLARAPALLMDDAVRAAGGTPGGVSSKLDVRIYPGDRAHRAVAAVLEELRATIEANLPGTLADVDTEFLHDLRVAVRRTRSIQRQLADVFPPEPLAHFRGEFRWLQQVTGATRDLDVNLLDFDELRATLPPAQRPDLAPLHEVLATRRRDEQRRMARALRSARATALLVAWAALLEDLSRQELGGPCSALPIAQVAGARIARVHRRMVRAGCAIDAATAAEALHDLRKTGKELRYLLELFAAAYPPEVITQMIRTLKALQDALGRFQDRQVQADRLRALRDDVGAREGGSAALMAMGLLVERLAGEQAAARSEFADRFAAFADPRQRRLVAETFR